MKNTLHLKEKKNDARWIIGLVSQDESYMLSININTQLGIKLSLTESISANNMLYTHFTYTDSSGFSYHIVENRKDGTYMIPTLKNVDFLFITSQVISSEMKQNITRKIKKCDGILAVIPVPAESVKKMHFLESI